MAVNPFTNKLKELDLTKTQSFSYETRKMEIQLMNSKITDKPTNKPKHKAPIPTNNNSKYIYSARVVPGTSLSILHI